jgi:hypothetical protein
MSSAAAAINTVSRNLIIYGGIFLAFFGIIGACANIYLFSRPRYRRVPCCLFMLTGAFFELIILCVALLMARIIPQLLKYDPFAFNIFTCKLRLYLIDACISIPIWCFCLSTFNRFCITSRDATRREWCTFNRSLIMLTALILMFFIYRSPDLYYVESFYTGDRLYCTFPSSVYIYKNLQVYFSFPVLLTTAPLIVIITLTICIRSNLRSFTSLQASNRMEQQITSMILLEALGASCLIPYTINLFYATITTTTVKNEYQLAIENLINQIVTLGFYVHYSSGFYIYLIASRDIRRNIQFVLHKIIWKFPFVRKLGFMNMRVAPGSLTKTISRTI